MHAIVLADNEEIDHNSIINNQESAKHVVDILTGAVEKVAYEKLAAMNDSAAQSDILTTSLAGGNLTLIQCCLDTAVQPSLNHKTLLLEDIGNTPHQLERILDQIRYSHLLDGSDAVLLGKFMHSNEDDDSLQAMIETILCRFAEGCAVPVFVRLFSVTDILITHCRLAPQQLSQQQNRGTCCPCTVADAKVDSRSGFSGGSALVVWQVMSEEKPPSYRDAIAGVLPAVVSIDEKRADGMNSTVGSGVIISRDGYILTNYHLVANLHTIEVGLADGETRIAALVGIDPAIDMAVLRISVQSELPFVPFC